MVKAPIDADLGGVVSECTAGIGHGMGINMALDIDVYDLM
jgi:primosomal protein N' (replication factor Y)